MLRRSAGDTHFLVPDPDVYIVFGSTVFGLVLTATECAQYQAALYETVRMA